MTLEELKKTWISNSQPEIQERIWDRAAGDYGAKPIPVFQEDPFLVLLAQNLAITKETKLLDIGCGAGRYSLALAPYVGKAHGVDISSQMILQAQLRSEALGLENTTFETVNWNEADIDALGFRGAFDVAFAHMTPAVADYATLDKMNSCSRNLCIIEKPTRRHDRVLDAAHLCVGNPAPGKDDCDIQNIFAYLWLKGYEPRFFYRQEKWNTTRKTEDMVVWCTERARLRKALSPEEEQRIRDLVESQAEAGHVMETTTTTRVTVIWKTGMEQ